MTLHISTDHPSYKKDDSVIVTSSIDNLPITDAFKLVIWDSVGKPLVYQWYCANCIKNNTATWTVPPQIFNKEDNKYTAQMEYGSQSASTKFTHEQNGK